MLRFLVIASSRKRLRPRILVALGLNLSVGILVAVLLWWTDARGAGSPFTAHLSSSLLHAVIYGMSFALVVPHVGAKLADLPERWKWVSIVACLAGIAALATLAIQLLSLWLGSTGEARFWPEVLYKGATVLLIALLIAAVIRVYERFREESQAATVQLRTYQLEKERALKLATEARLSSLESRLHPHFLFNTLNCISALIAEDPRLAERTVQRLATLLRTALDACARSSVPLREELDLVVDYLEINKLRFRDRLTYSIDIEPGLEHANIPPLTLQPLVENSVKFAVAPSPAGADIRISARTEAGRLLLGVWDSGPGFSLDTIPRGHGLDTLAARLRALLGESAELSATRRRSGTLVAVSLPMPKKAEDAHRLSG